MSYEWYKREPVDLLLGKKPVGYKYVLKTNYKPNGDIEKWKVKLVAQGFLHQEVMTETKDSHWLWMVFL